MKPRTRQAKLVRFDEIEEAKIEVTYAPAENMLVFRSINCGILPITKSIKEIWEGEIRRKWIEARKAAYAEANKPDPRQFEHPVIIEACKVAAQVPNEVLPPTGPEIIQEPVVRDVPPPEVAREEPAAVCIRESEAQGEAARPQVQPIVRPIRPIRKPDRVCAPEGEAQQVTEH